MILFSIQLAWGERRGCWASGQGECDNVECETMRLGHRGDGD